MARKDYYLLLGISRGESPNGIRKAFRDLARRHHPDHAGPGGTPIFREVVEAYRVLSDPKRRREYDAEVDSRIPVHLSTADPVPERERWDRPLFDPLDLFADLASIRPASEDLFDHILRNFLWAGTPKSERPEPLLCDIALSAEEARGGGVLPLRVPIREPCFLPAPHSWPNSRRACVPRTASVPSRRIHPRAHWDQRSWIRR